MANRLKMAIIQAILHLHSLRWSRRRIADELGIDRDTVRRYRSQPHYPLIIGRQSMNQAVPSALMSGTPQRETARKPTGDLGAETEISRRPRAFQATIFAW